MRALTLVDTLNMCGGGLLGKLRLLKQSLKDVRTPRVWCSCLKHTQSNGLEQEGLGQPTAEHLPHGQPYGAT